MLMSLAPITGFAIEYGAVALATYAATRAIPQLPRSQPTADALDEVGKGLSLRRGREQLNATTHWRRNVKFGKTGRSIEIDTTALTRTLLRKVT